MNDDERAFWQFSLRFYRRSEVPVACLSLQDQQGVDVNVLFFVLFLATNQRRVSADDIRRMETRISPWRTRVVQPLRAIRRDLKNGIAPVDNAAAENLRSAIQRDELQAERLQQETLEREFPPASTGTYVTTRLAAEANIAAYGEIIGTLPAAPVNTLLSALFDELSV